MSQKAEKPPDPAHEAKLAARRKAYALKVWKADPKTQEQQQELDAARAQLQILRDDEIAAVLVTRARGQHQRRE